MTATTLPAGVCFPSERTTPHECPACGTQAARILYSVTGIPVHSNMLLATREEALAYPTGDLELAFCEACGFLFNPLFDPERLASADDYEETQGFSGTFRAWMNELIEGLLERYPLRGGHALEIGCGKGEFLSALCSIGRMSGLGFDPTFDPTRNTVPPHIEFRREFYGTEHADVSADVLCCRHTLEHIPDVAGFASQLRTNIGDRHPLVFFEVPDTLRELREGAFWDIYYEHCSYFTPGSIGRLFRAQGFEIEQLSLGYGDQYILLEARPQTASSSAAHDSEEPLADVHAAAEAFANSCSESIAHWHAELTRAHAAGKRIVLWGSGSKGVAFLTTLGNPPGLDHVVDINPHKHGQFMASTGQEIISPERLRDIQPDLVIIMNPVYTKEISAQLADLGLEPRILAL